MQRRNDGILVWGTANPVGVADSSYAGIYLTDKDIDSIVPNMIGMPVKIEHKGRDVGKVVSAWKHDGRMDLVLSLDGQSLESRLVSELVQRKKAKDLSLGYMVQMSKGVDGKMMASDKKVVEVSIVVEGARENCHIRGWR